MTYIIQFFTWFKNLFTKTGRTDNFFIAAAKNLRKVVLSKYDAKKKAVKQVGKWQTGTKKSNFELKMLAFHTGLMDELKSAGVKTDWFHMKFLN